MQPRREQCPSTPTRLTVHEIELIGVIDQKAPAPERTGRRVRELSVCGGEVRWGGLCVT